MDFFGWEDLDGDGHVDEVESLLADDLMCTNDEEREMNDGIGGLGPTSGSFGLESGIDGDVDEEFHDGLEIDLLNADIDPDDFRLMDEEERLEALDDAGLDPDDYDDFFLIFEISFVKLQSICTCVKRNIKLKGTTCIPSGFCI